MRKHLPEGSTYIDIYSHVKIKQSGKWKYEHRVIMEQLLGRPLLRNEIVHHINKNPSDNRPKNLKLCSGVAEHMRYHRKKIDKNRVCSIPGCTNRYSCCGYCHTHYTRFKKYGDPLYKKTRDTCSVEGCSRKHKGLGYCDLHYQRFKNHGDPLYEKAQQLHTSPLIVK